MQSKIHTLTNYINFYSILDPKSGAKTQLIENTWWCVKRTLPPTHTSNGNFHGFLCDFLWRRTLKIHGNDLFCSFMEACTTFYKRN